ncbi:MAG TPA: FtsK/SpoIIIE domain-containing protein, partial [Trebonia sp.]
MSRIAWHRPARIPVPALPSDRLMIAAPPTTQNQSNGSMMLTMLLPLMSSVSIAAYLIAFHSTLTIFLAVGILTLSVSVTFAVRYQMRAATRKTRQRQLDRYAAHLGDIKQTARELAGTQRSVAVWRWPSPARLWAIAKRRRRVWERRPGDDDFLRVRIGLGRGVLTAPLVLATRGDPTVEYEPELMANANRMIEKFGIVGKQPVLVDLAEAGVISLVGPADAARAVCRGLLCQVGVLHAPDDVTIMISAGDDYAAWNWASWLPHTRDPQAKDPAMPALIAFGYAGIADAVERAVRQAQGDRAENRPALGGRREKSQRHRTIIVIDAFRPGSPWAREPLARRLVEVAGPGSGITVVALVEETAQEPSRVDLRVFLDEAGTVQLEPGSSSYVGDVTEGTADRPSIELAEATARAVAPLILTEENQEALARTVPLTELLGIDDAANFEPERLWVPPGDERILTSAIGVASDGRELVLDLKEAAQGGMGPHGLIVGATGSGKSELLRTLLTGLTMSHSPDLLSLVLVDFKGGATFAGMTGLPHVAGLITNLADDLAMVDRVRDALVGEQQRRQRMLRDAGNVDSLRQYQARQAA